MKTLNILVAAFVMAVLSSCNNEKSLQKYYVDNQEDTDFLALDIPVSMFANVESLEAEQKETMESIKKINVLMLEKKEDPAKFEQEKQKLNEIFKNDKYQLLMKYGGGNRKAALYFTGDDDAIDELIVFGYDDEKGLGVGRVLGEDMNPENIMKLMKSLEKDDINVEGIKGISEIFGNSGTKNDSVKVDMETETESAAEVDSGDE
ncbi:hypothetical protein GCM10023115_50320 [Pontixanthobacter gangjinensis]|uniref:DUF4252 domain-containing protein n=1 Tax=Christiangramia aestuarii TaxID=1028746 RepID=A0A7K1LPA2_9FLAO|nr:DUF4252 domain-containing protein [Christiangramia aestuarii]MUP42614.1 DUF4252 domain-containing protein [Christiangramia aestuarii]